LANAERETDYLVVGAGAMGMAFADELLTQRPSARVALVDRHARPGGHWNDAYSFVSLHQPAAYYGVNSLALGRGGSALASGREVLSYYEEVLRRLLSTGRLDYFPLCEHRGGGVVQSLIEPERAFTVRARECFVDATYMNVEVPSVTAPRYEVDPEVSLVPPNALPDLREPHPEYVVIGAGKTGIDAVLFLLGNRVEPDRIAWIMPNDAWLLDRAHIQPGRMLDAGAASPFESFHAAGSLTEVLRWLEGEGRLLRLDPDVWPEKYRCATVSRDELTQLRRVHRVIRAGRVMAVAPGRLTLEQGVFASAPGALHIDCTANGLARREGRPVFAPGRITLQSLFMCQQVFSASVIARIECLDAGPDEKNALSRPVPHPEVNRDYVFALANSLANTNDWGRVFGRWLRRNRLFFIHHEAMWTLVLAGLRGRRVAANATANLREVFTKEFPGQECPL
jgi:hypothetical protein